MFCLTQQRVEEHILYQERTILADSVLVVVTLGKELNKVCEPIVLAAHRAVLSCHKLRVDPMVGRDLLLAELEALHNLIPYGGVVHARLPGVTNIDESFARRI